MPFDVFTPDPLGLRFVDDAGNVGPEVTWIRVAGAMTGVTERLTGITGREEMNSAAQWSRVEGSQVVPDRSLTQGLVFHPGHESGCCVTFPLDESHSAVFGFGDVQSEVEAAVSCTEGQSPEVVRLGVIFGT